MKHIALLRDDRPFWDDVAWCLHEANVMITSFGAEWAPEDVIDLSPDLIVTNLLNLKHFKISLRRIPKVAIQVAAEEARHLPASKLAWNLEVVGWPTGKDEFLQVTSRQLAISPRKSYACIFRIYSDDEDDVATAQTMNLSMTGLAFKSIADFEVGQSLKIALDLPGEKRSLEAQVKIVRCDEEDDSDPRTMYGAEYIDPSDQLRRSLKKFIHTY